MELLLAMYEELGLLDELRIPREVLKKFLVRYVYSIYRGTIPNGKNLPLTQFRHLRQLLGRSCSYLLPRQDGGISQNYVSGRFLPFGMVPL